MANADLALGRGEVDSALNILTMIGPEQIYFIQVKWIAKISVVDTISKFFM